MIGIIDYGLGNIGAFVNVYKRMNIQAKVAKSAQDLAGITHVILPGVGAFDHAMQLLNASGMRQPLDELVAHGRTPVLGICVGMQILAQSSDEGSLPGLGYVQGSVKGFANAAKCAALPLPHMGWNDVVPQKGLPLFRGLEDDARFYFLHSFYFDCASEDSSAASATYGIDFSCAVKSASVFGVQFHPEKSHHWGAMLLKNFAEI